MSISDGQDVSAAVSNPAWISKNTDDTTPSRLGLGSTLPAQGPSITWAQQQFNSIASFLGVAINGVYNLLPTWVTSNRGSAGDNIFQRVSAIDTAFHATTGHKHTGAAGDAPRLPAGSIAYVVVDGGDTNYSIQSTDDIIRAKTVLTADRTYRLPACSALSLGERHIIKNPPSQTFNIILAVTGGDTIDGDSSISILPGKSVTVNCGEFSISGVWDLI
jgi:hypothetical protein